MDASGSPTYLRRRVSRPHFFCVTGRQVLAPSISALRDAERRRVPAELARLQEHFHERIAEAPPPFDWLAEATRGLVPVLEIARFEGRVYGHLRLAHPFTDRLSKECFGCDAEAPAPCPAGVPPPLAWMRENLGTIGLVPEQSGTAPFGRTLAEIGEELGDHFADLPAGAEDWVSLYEADGDWVFADVARDETVWLGAEWSGEAITRYALPWARAASFVLWRLLDGGHVRPVDLRMLAAG